MVNHGIGAVPNAVAHSFQPPAKVNFLHMCKKVRIKSACGLPAAPFDEKSGATCPEYFTGIIILAHVLFRHVQYPPSTERKPVSIQISTRRACVLKLVPLIMVPDLRVRHSPVRLCVPKYDHP